MINDDMEFFDFLELNNWNQLNDQDKAIFFDKILLYFVNPLLPVDNISLRNFQLCGFLCRTFQVEINHEPFILIPGRLKANLGWNQGSEGLKIYDILAKHAEQQLTEPQSRLISVDEIDDYINQFTSPLRQTNIMPMLVAKHAQPSGITLKGIYNCITGDYRGDTAFYGCYREKIQHALFPNVFKKTKVLDWEFPENYLMNNNFYLQQSENPDHYLIYQHAQLTYEEICTNIHKSGFDLLTEDQWEYVVGGGSRRLFWWGNELKLEQKIGCDAAYHKIRQPNMFGLIIDNSRKKYELTQDRDCLKLGKSSMVSLEIEQLLPLSTYFRAGECVPSGPLDSACYLCRKVIPIGF